MPSLVKRLVGSLECLGSLDLAASFDLARSASKVPAMLLVSIPAHCKAYFVLAVSMPALWQLRVICLTMVLGEAGLELDIAAALPVNASLAS